MVSHLVSAPQSTTCSFSVTSYSSTPLLILPLHQNPNDTTATAIVRCSSTRSHDRPTTGRLGFDPRGDYHHDGVFDAAASKEEKKKNKQRNWWSDYDYDDYDGYSDFYELGIDEEDDFWGFKIFRAFGWMLPAIAVSLLLGTGPNAFFMALAIPLGQSALSFAVNKVWGMTSGSPISRPKTKNKKKPFARAANDVKTSEQQEENNTGKGRESYWWWYIMIIRS